MKKYIIFIIAASVPAFAESDRAGQGLLCVGSLIQNTNPAYPAHFWPAPSQKPIVFSYERGAEKTVYIGKRFFNGPTPEDPKRIPQWGLEEVRSEAEAVIVAKFANSFAGERLPRKEFSLSLFEVENPRNAAYFPEVPGAGQPLASLGISLGGELKGYLVLSCVNRR